MQISLSTNSFKGLGKPKKCIDGLLDAGIQGITLDLGRLYPPAVMETYGMEQKGSDTEKARSVIDGFLQECMKSPMTLDVVRAPRLKWDTKRTDTSLFMLQIGKESIRICRKAHAKYIVIQPLFAGLAKRDVWQENDRYYKELGKLAQENGICILLENQCGYRRERFVRGVCSNPSETAGWIQQLNQEFGEEIFGFCLDTCAGTLGRQNPGEMAVEMGDCLKAVLLRECDFFHEMGGLPFMGKKGECTDWAGIIRGLRKIDFDGALIMDAGDTMRNLSHLLYPYLYPLIRSVADYIGWQIGLEKRIKRDSQRVLFGAGNMCKAYMEYYGDQYPPLFVCDNDSRLWGESVCGLEVKSPDALKGLPGECAVIICNTFYEEIAVQLRDLGIENIGTFSDEYLFSEMGGKVKNAEDTYSFITVENMTSVYEITDILDLPQTAYTHFMDYDDEVLYLLRDGRMAGVLSIGDLERYYDRQECELRINTDYTSIPEIDFKAAAIFFERIKTINEMPVVTNSKELLGVIRKPKENWLRERQRHALKYAVSGRYRFGRDEIWRFMNGTKARVLFYKYSINRIVNRLDRRECERLDKRRKCTDANIWKGLSEEEWKNFWQSEYEEGLVDTMRQEIIAHKPVLENGVAVYPDMEGKCFQFANGYRVTPNNPSAADRRIFMFGPCIVMGAYCKDDQTIESYLQGYLVEDHYTEWKVLNRGAYSPEYCYGHMFLQELSEDDVVIVICEEKWAMDQSTNNIILQGDLTADFLKIPSLSNNLVDTPSHCNYIVNQQLAERIYKDIRQTGMLDTSKEAGVPERLQDYYINWDVHAYFADYFEQYGLHREPDNVRTGAVVMNCNPFTKGHRYLIEQALGMVDRLYLFVVEEDKSYFRFEDRFQMVKSGVADLGNVQVVPSGKYVISKDTFAQYFEKECVQTVESMDYDLYIFGGVVAAGLGIQYRFAGEEPFDPVTRAYNEAMKRILPAFGVEVVEFPRVSLEENGEVVSATLVRKAIMEKDTDRIQMLCPESTQILLEKYLL